MAISTIMLSFGVLLTALPIGWMLAWLCKDELVQGRKWFVRIIISFSALFLASLIFYRNVSVLFSLSYMVVVTYVSLHKSKDEKFVRLN